MRTDNRWFLPHFPIIHPEKSTTKVRIVYDGSAKCEGTSLNDVFIRSKASTRFDQCTSETWKIPCCSGM